MKFSVILADPPWSYRDKRDKHPRMCGGARAHYHTMSTSDIAALPIKDITDHNSILFMWATWPCIKDALYVIEQWGFIYKTCGFIWVKLNKNNGWPFFGIGHYTKSNAEPCLLAIRGRPNIISNSVSQVVMSIREKHSQKPHIVRDRIVKLMGNVSKIELFAREKVEGWDALGFDIDGTDIKDSLVGKAAE